MPFFVDAGSIKGPRPATSYTREEKREYRECRSGSISIKSIWNRAAARAAPAVQNESVQQGEAFGAVKRRRAGKWFPSWPLECRQDDRASCLMHPNSEENSGPASGPFYLRFVSVRTRANLTVPGNPKHFVQIGPGCAHVFFFSPTH